MTEINEEIRFDNTPEGRLAAEQHSYRVGKRGFWEEFVDLSDDSAISSKVVPLGNIMVAAHVAEAMAEAERGIDE